jgi:hypothetical protein
VLVVVVVSSLVCERCAQSIHIDITTFYEVSISVLKKMLSPASEGKSMLGWELREDVGIVVTSITNRVRIYAYHT